MLGFLPFMPRAPPLFLPHTHLPTLTVPPLATSWGPGQDTLAGSLGPSTAWPIPDTPFHRRMDWLGSSPLTQLVASG